MLAAALGAPAPARAVFQRAQMDRIDMEPLFDSEYFLDLLSFSYPTDWLDLWRSTPSGYRINAASLDCCDLMLQQDLVYRKPLTERFRFAFRLEQDEDKDKQELHHWLELEHDVGGGFSAILFGEPTFRKEDADIGVGAAYRRGAWRAEARHDWVDWNFNHRGHTTERYDRFPATETLAVSRRVGGGEVSASAEFDLPTRRRVPDQNRVFSYRRTRAGVTVQAPCGTRTARLAYSYEFERKGDRFLPDPAAASVDMSRNVHQVRASLDSPAWDGARLETGQAFLLRAARADRPDFPDRGVFYRHWELQPYARLRQAWGERLIGETAAFLSFGERRARGAGSVPSEFNDVVEAKIGLGLDVVFSPSARIGLYATFDADSPGHGWDGGNVRALFLF